MEVAPEVAVGEAPLLDLDREHLGQGSRGVEARVREGSAEHQQPRSALLDQLLDRLEGPVVEDRLALAVAGLGLDVA